MIPDALYPSLIVQAYICFRVAPHLMIIWQHLPDNLYLTLRIMNFRLNAHISLLGFSKSLD